MVLRFGCILLSLAVAVPIGAQQIAQSAEAIQFQIRGRVVEFGGSRGLVEAQVNLERWDGPAVSSLVKRSETGTAKTDVGGSFVFELDRPGTYRLTATKDGYGKPGGFARNWTSTDITVDAARRIGNVLFVLARPGEVTGSVMEEDTRKPVSGLRVSLMEYGFLGGRLILGTADGAVTDADGRFIVREAIPTDYVVALPPLIRATGVLAQNPRLPGEAEMLTDFSEKDIETIDHDYDWTYWPGGHDLANAIPFTLDSGGRVDVGRLTIRKVPKDRVRVSLQSEPCLADERFVVHIRPSSQTPTIPAERVPCGKDVLIRGLPPDSYQLDVNSPSGKRGTMQFHIVDRNVAITVPVARGVDINGKVLLPEGATGVDFQTMRVLLLPIRTYSTNLPANPDATGSFTMENVSAREFRVVVSDVPKTHCLKEIRYKGNGLTDDILAVDAGAPDQSLQIILDDKPAAVSGRVTENDRPAARPHAVLVKWPPNRRDLFASVSRTEGDERGQFQFTGITPGEYRILAVTAEDRWNLERPGVLARLLERADKLTLGEGQYQSVSVGVMKP